MWNAKAICWAIRGQPQRRLRCFMSTTAWMSSALGPFGPGFRRRFGENSILNWDYQHWFNNLYCKTILGNDRAQMVIAVKSRLTFAYYSPMIFAVCKDSERYSPNVRNPMSSPWFH